jgi:hypothetical protein
VRPVDVDFLPPRHLLRWFFITIGFLLFAAAGMQAHGAWRATAETDRLQDQLSRDAAQRTQMTASAVVRTDSQRPPPPYEQDAARIAQIADFDVARVLTIVESARVAGIRVTSLEILAAERVVNLEVEWREGQALLAYVDALNQGEAVQERWQLQRVHAGTSNVAGAATFVLRLPVLSRP